MTEPFDPYYRWLGIRDSQRPPNHYRLLGLELFETDVGVIEAGADRQMAFLRTFQTGPHGELSQRILTEVSQARLCLVNPAKREVYDAALRNATAALATTAAASTAASASPHASSANTSAPAPGAAADAAPADPEALARRTAQRKKLLKQVGLIWGVVLGVVALLLIVSSIWSSASKTVDLRRHGGSSDTSEITGEAATGEATAQAPPKTPELTAGPLLTAHQISVWSLGISDDGQVLISGSADESVRTWKAAENEKDRLIDAHQAIVSCVAVSPDGHYAATSDVSGQAYLWRLDRSEPLFENKFQPAPTALAFAPDSLSVAVGLGDGNVVLWNVGSGEQAAPIHAQEGKLSALAWYDDLRFLTGGQSPEIRLYKRDGTLERSFPTVAGATYSLAAIASKSQFASAHQNGEIIEWGVESDSPVRVLSGHAGPVRAVSTTSDGSRLLSGGEDGTVRLWDLAAGVELARSPPRAGFRVLTAVVSPDGRRAWSAGTEPSIRSWELPAPPK